MNVMTEPQNLPPGSEALLDFTNHVVDGVPYLGIGQVDTAAFRWHVTG